MKLCTKIMRMARLLAMPTTRWTAVAAARRPPTSMPAYSRHWQCADRPRLFSEPLQNLVSLGAYVTGRFGAVAAFARNRRCTRSRPPKLYNVFRRSCKRPQFPGTSVDRTATSLNESRNGKEISKDFIEKECFIWSCLRITSAFVCKI